MEQPITSKQLADLAFKQSWQSVFVFLVPAGLALLIGRWLDNGWQDSKVKTIICLGLAFIISWSIVLRRYASFRQMAKQAKEQPKNQS
ncbi:MAG TPA: hypothetical protein PLT32_01160 [bacterium]|nr:hypothetical protein [bacterium]